MDDEATDHNRENILLSVGIDLDEIRENERDKVLDEVERRLKLFFDDTYPEWDDIEKELSLIRKEI